MTQQNSKLLCVSGLAAALVASVITQSGSAAAQEIYEDMYVESAGVFARRCRQVDYFENVHSHSTESLRCMAYIQGLLDMAMEMKRRHPELEDYDTVCPPGGRVTGDLVRRTFLEYMDKHPDASEENRRDVIIWAVEEAYPCAASEGSEDTILRTAEQVE